MFNIQDELKKLPDKPGVYLMKDSFNHIIYIGKAKILKNRVRQYFQSSRNQTPKVVQMVKNIQSYEIIVTDSELEALILECNLIKHHRPKYNIMMKDDKHYPYIKVSLSQPFPKIYMVRSVGKDKAKYYGPYISAQDVRETVDTASNIFKLRSCNRVLPRDIGKKRPCLNYHIGRCSAPCGGHISQEAYNQQVRNAMDFIEGKHDDIVRTLKMEMQKASEEMLFEKAIELRNRIQSIERIFEKQKMDGASSEDQDIIAFARAHGEALIQIFFVRQGKMVGREHFLMNNTEEMSRKMVVGEFIKQFYSGGAFVPREVIVQEPPEDEAVIGQWLNSLRGKNVKITWPQKGEKHQLIELASKNALLTLEQSGEEMKREERRTKGALKEIAEALRLDCILHRVEAYDISNIQGFESVGSMVAFENGKPKRSDYRKFRIKSVKGPNDYASMKEMVFRRFRHALKEQSELAEKGLSGEEGKFTRLPELIMMDGGKAQVKAATEALAELNITIPVCGMIKDDKHRTKGLLYENKEVLLPKNSEGFKLATRIQDEVHRFSIEYHRKLREQKQVHSILDDIQGIGPARRKALMKHFGDIDKIRMACLEELAEASGMNKKAAQAVYEYFH